MSGETKIIAINPYWENECSKCYVCWVGAQKSLCAFCEERDGRYYPPIQVLDRQIKMMKNARASRLPETLRLMFDVFSDWINRTP